MPPPCDLRPLDSESRPALLLAQRRTVDLESLCRLCCVFSRFRFPGRYPRASQDGTMALTQSEIEDSYLVTRTIDLGWLPMRVFSARAGHLHLDRGFPQACCNIDDLGNRERPA